MAYTIVYSDRFQRQLNKLDTGDKNFIEARIEVYLRHQPGVESKKRKRLRSNPVADWELRLEDWRVLYNIYEDVVEVELIALGVKRREKLIIDDEEVKL